LKIRELHHRQINPAVRWSWVTIGFEAEAHPQGSAVATPH
jgi:hypothetical protein